VAGKGVTGISATGIGVEGVSGPGGISPITPNPGVWGFSDSGDGVNGGSATSTGVRGFSGSATKAGVTGEGQGSGVQGYVGPAPTPPARANTGVYGIVASGGWGVYGEASSGFAVWGSTATGTGILGEATGTGAAIFGWAAGSGPAITGQAASSTGVLGYSGPGDAPAPRDDIGVFGACASGTAVLGESESGTAISGSSSTGSAIVAEAAGAVAAIVAANTGTGGGLDAQATTGVAGRFSADTLGVAIQAAGRVKFSTAGIATVAAATNSILVDPGIPLDGNSKVLCTLIGDAGGNTMIKRVGINTATDIFRIYLTANTVAAVRVAWFVIS
jgi:hypothetical protein